MVPKKKLIKFQHEILDWYNKNKREFPWRNTRDPYAILISEIMSQQTQISRVVEKYIVWMNAFPTINVLAAADFEEILRLWSGLGYNRRALYLKQLAQVIVTKYDEVFPRDMVGLRQLPGIGEYTASALMCFAFDEQIPVIDTNVKKVIAIKFFNGEIPPKNILESIAVKLIPKGKAYEWNQALMDYASLELKKEKIFIPKQPRFKGSDRYYRGKIIRALLNDKKDIYTIKEEVGGERFNNILNSLYKDGLIKNLGDSVELS